MASHPSPVFGDVLRRYRAAAGLSQEALAERAGLSAEAISMLERGARNAPHQDTVVRLATALRLANDERTQLEAAAPRRRGPAPGASWEARQATGLSTSLTSFVGREWELAEVTEQLARCRLLTLTGPPGIGKTRLALAVAARAATAYADGVCFVPLAPIRDSDLVLSAVAEALHVRELGHRPLRDLLMDHLRDRRLLLVLDNFEHVLAAAPLLTDLLTRCPRLSMLVTSRAALRLQGERVFPVPPLAVPPSGPRLPFPSLADYAAVRLFLDRAQAARADVVGGEDGAAVVEICRRLEGVPLAIELAAARLRALSPRALLARLDRRLPLLSGGAQDLPARQRTLQTAIAWSYDLLTTSEQTLFRRLGAFAGGCTLEAAAAVCFDDEFGGRTEQEARYTGPTSIAVLDGLTALLEQSLLQRDEQPDGEPRFFMLEMVREYAAEQLAGSREAAEIARAHAAYFLSLAEGAYEELAGRQQVAWFDRLERDHDNMRAALSWAETTNDGTTGLRLAAALHRFWRARGHLSEGRAWLARQLAAAPTEEGDAHSVRARQQALMAAGTLAHIQGDFAAARELHEASLALSRSLGDVRAIAECLNGVGTIWADGDYERATAALEESLSLAELHGSPLFTYRALYNLGEILAIRGEVDRAEALLRDALSLERTQGDTWSIARTLRSLADVVRRRGDGETAEAFLAESLALSRQSHYPGGSAEALRRQADLALDRGDTVVARSCLREALMLQRQVGHVGELACLLEGYGSLAAAGCQWMRSLRLAGAAATLRAGVIAAYMPADRADRVAEARRALGEAAAAAAWADGQAMAIEQAIAYALADEGDE